MKIRSLVVLALLLSPLCMPAQSRPATSATATTSAAPGPRMGIGYHGELGKWWQSSEIVRKLQLSDDQIGQLDQTFYDHKLKLIDYGAEMEKQDLKLQALLWRQDFLPQGAASRHRAFDRAFAAGCTSPASSAPSKSGRNVLSIHRRPQRCPLRFLPTSAGGFFFVLNSEVHPYPRQPR